MDKSKFGVLKELVRNRRVAIGVDRNHANNFWYRQTVIGKVLNWITNLSFILSIVVFFKFGFMNGLFTVIGIGIYSLVIQKIASIYLRVVLLHEKDGELFGAAYQERSVTIKDNSTGKIYSYPTSPDWENAIHSVKSV